MQKYSEEISHQEYCLIIILTLACRCKIALQFIGIT